jgi:hypothetical protein
MCWRGLGWSACRLEEQGGLCARIVLTHVPQALHEADLPWQRLPLVSRVDPPTNRETWSEGRREKRQEAGKGDRQPALCDTRRAWRLPSLLGFAPPAVIAARLHGIDFAVALPHRQLQGSPHHDAGVVQAVRMCCAPPRSLPCVSSRHPAAWADRRRTQSPCSRVSARAEGQRQDTP